MPHTPLTRLQVLSRAAVTAVVCLVVAASAVATVAYYSWQADAHAVSNARAGCVRNARRAAVDVHYQYEAARLVGSTRLARLTDQYATDVAGVYGLTPETMTPEAIQRFCDGAFRR